MIPLSDKQRDQLAQAQLLKQYGQNFFRFTIQERQRMRDMQRAAIDAAYVAPALSAKIAEHIHTDGPVGDFKVQQDVQQTSERFEQSAKKLNPEYSVPVPYQAKPLAEAIQTIPAHTHKHDTFSLSIELNAKQTLAAEYAEAGKCFVLTGPAGTGKTTGCREIAKRLLMSGKLREHDFKLGGGERILAPSIAFSAFTNRATDNMRRALHKDPELEQDLMYNVVTIHKLLEYEPVFYDVQDDKGEWRTTMRFEPQRTAKNPLRLTHLVIEESSMLGTDLGIKLLEALPKDCQIIYVGDINQLPPIFAKSMLNYALILLPVVELTEVYRQALESPIIANAHRILRGEMIEDCRPFFQHVSGKALKIMPTQSGCVNQLVNSLKSWYDAWIDPRADYRKEIPIPSDPSVDESQLARKYDPEQDIVLAPWNKGEAGTNILNSHIAQFLGQKRNAIVYEIFAGMRKLYLAVGDRVMVSKQDGTIVKINHNGQYLGRMPKPANTDLTRFGMQLVGNKNIEHEDLELELSSYAALNVDAIPDTNEEKKQEASHVVEVKLDNGQTVVLNSIGEFAESVFTLGYALTVHKAQGCEWRKVFILLHKEHSISLNREMLYTAVTRAREYCIIVDLCNVVENAIANQRIMGNSVEEKIEWFNSEVSLLEPVPVVPYLDNVMGAMPDNVVRVPKVTAAMPVPVIESKKEPVKLVRLCDLIGENLAGEYMSRLVVRWNDARKIWGDKIGQVPYLDYNLQRARTIGLASLQDHTIKLNPLWVLLGEKDAHIKDEMLGETLDHEICHLVAWKFAQDRGHDSGWRMAMQLMGRQPKVFATSDDLPSWTKAYTEHMQELRASLTGTADLQDDYTISQHDEV